MPNKARRAAARQTQLSQRKRKERGRFAAPLPSEERMPAAPAPEEGLEKPAPAPLLRPATPTAPAPASVPSRAPEIQRLRPYLVKELRRIAILSALILAILVVLTVLLGS